jgi:hypothetical protein
MHECPKCGEICDCYGEDTWYSWPENLDCVHACEPDYEDEHDRECEEDYG